MILRPFFSFYGAKWRAAPRYPKPFYRTIVEPFAGSAGYSLRYPHLEIILVEKDPVIAALWRYLIGVSESEIRNLPLMSPGQHVDDLAVSDEAKILIGFWLNRGGSGPCKTPGAWMRDERYTNYFWSERVRERVAAQLPQIRHWTVRERDYSQAPDIEATWFIDPPYEAAGVHYKHSSKAIDFKALGAFCEARKGQVMVCENTGASWLPFQHFMDAKSMEGGGGKSKSAEAIWTNSSPA